MTTESFTRNVDSAQNILQREGIAYKKQSGGDVEREEENQETIKPFVEAADFLNYKSAYWHKNSPMVVNINLNISALELQRTTFLLNQEK